MKTVEQFKELINRYYQRDDETKEQYEDFKSQYSYSNLKSTFESLSEIEKKFKITLPQDYKTFIETDSAWYMNGETEQFGIYDEKRIYEFNYIGNFSGKRYIDNEKLLEILKSDYGVVEVPDGYIPHHDINNGVFQFVEESIHNEFTHIGGNSLHGGN